MRFSKTELGILKQVAEGNRRVKEIAKVLNKSKFQIYRSGQKLIEKGFVDLSDGFYEPIKSTPSTLLVQLLGEFPSAIEPLSDSGINILKCLFDAKTIKEIMQESGIKRTQVFKKIKQARGISLVRKIDEHYKLNEKIWSKAIEFLKDPEKFNFYLEILANFPKLINSNAGPRFKFLKEKVQGREDEFLTIFLKYLRLILLDSSDPQGRMKMNEIHQLCLKIFFDIQNSS